MCRFKSWLLTFVISSSSRLAREFGLESKHPYVEKLQRVQCILQDVNANIATPLSSAREVHLKRTEFDAHHVAELEEWIDFYSSQLPPLENFILPVTDFCFLQRTCSYILCNLQYIYIVFFFRVEVKQALHFTQLERFVAEPKGVLFHSYGNLKSAQRHWNIWTGE